MTNLTLEEALKLQLDAEDTAGTKYQIFAAKNGKGYYPLPVGTAHCEGMWGSLLKTSKIKAGE